MGDRANINQSYGGRQSMLDGEQIMQAMGGSIPGIAYTRSIAARTAGQRTVLLFGSSTMERWPQSGTGPANAAVTKSSDGTTFAAVGTTGAGAATFGDIVQRALNENVRLITKGSGGTTSAGWNSIAGGSLLAGAIASSQAAGGLDAAHYQCNFNDALQGIITSQAGQEAILRGVFSKLRSALGQPNLPIFISGTQKYTGTDTVQDQQFTWARAAELAVAADPNNYWGSHVYDLPQGGDGIHQLDSSYPIHARRVATNVLAVLAGGIFQNGPTMVAVTPVSSTALDVTLSHSSGADFTPTTGITAFALSFNNFTSLTAIATAIRVGPVTVRLTYADSAGAIPTVGVVRGAAPDTSGVVKDDSTLNLPINPHAGITASFGIGGTPTPSPTPSPTPTPAPTPTPSPTPTPTPSFTAQKTVVAFSRSNAPPPGVNAFPDSGTQVQNSNQGLTRNLNDVNGVATGATITSTTPFIAGNDTQGIASGTSYPSGVDPTLGYHYNGTAANGDNGGVAISSTTYTYAGLPVGATYTLTLEGYRSATGRPVNYTAGGVTKSIAAGNEAGNVHTAVFTGLIVDANGKIAFQFAPGSGGTLGYVSRATLERTA